MAFEATEDVRDFALGGVGWQPLHVQRARGVAGQLCRHVVGLRAQGQGEGAARHAVGRWAHAATEQGAALGR